MFQWYSMYDPGVASAVHSYYGSGIADLSRGQLSDWLIGSIDKCEVLLWGWQSKLKTAEIARNYYGCTRCVYFY